MGGALWFQLNRFDVSPKTLATIGIGTRWRGSPMAPRTGTPYGGPIDYGGGRRFTQDYGGSGDPGAAGTAGGGAVGAGGPVVGVEVYSPCLV
jgi:hypothetical protein